MQVSQSSIPRVTPVSLGTEGNVALRPTVRAAPTPTAGQVSSTLPSPEHAYTLRQLVLRRPYPAPLWQRPRKLARRFNYSGGGFCTFAPLPLALLLDNRGELLHE